MDVQQIDQLQNYHRHSLSGYNCTRHLAGELKPETHISRTLIEVLRVTSQARDIQEVGHVEGQVK